MGVIQKILSVAEVGEKRGLQIEFELNENNHSSVPKVNGLGGIIHIQNNIWRIEMFLPEFIEFATCCVEAGQKLKKNKNITNE
jgi:hypothetical protein